MKLISRILIAALLLVCAPQLHAQQNAFTPAPDCQFQINGATATGRSPNSNPGGQAGYHNTNGCTTWTMVYAASGFSAVSLELDEAPDVAGNPGSWVTFPTLASGAQPLTSVTAGQITGYKYYPWVSVNLNTLTAGASANNSISVMVFGWRPGSNTDASVSPTAAGGTGVPAGTAFTGNNPVVIAGTSTGAASGNVAITRVDSVANLTVTIGAGASTSSLAAAAGTTNLAGNPFGSGAAEDLATVTYWPYTFTPLVATAGQSYKGSAGVLDHIFVSSGSSITIALWDQTGTSCSTTPILPVTTVTGPIDIPVHAYFANGLCAIVTGTVTGSVFLR